MLDLVWQTVGDVPISVMNQYTPNAQMCIRDRYMDGVDIDHPRFYEMLVERDELPKTGQVNPDVYKRQRLWRGRWCLRC